MLEEFNQPFTGTKQWGIRGKLPCYNKSTIEENYYLIKVSWIMPTTTNQSIQCRNLNLIKTVETKGAETRWYYLQTCHCRQNLRQPYQSSNPFVANNLNSTTTLHPEQAYCNLYHLPFSNTVNHSFFPWQLKGATQSRKAPIIYFCPDKCSSCLLPKDIISRATSNIFARKISIAKGCSYIQTTPNRCDKCR